MKRFIVFSLCAVLAIVACKKGQEKQFEPVEKLGTAATIVGVSEWIDALGVVLNHYDNGDTSSPGFFSDWQILAKKTDAIGKITDAEFDDGVRAALPGLTPQCNKCLLQLNKRIKAWNESSQSTTCCPSGETYVPPPLWYYWDFNSCWGVYQCAMWWQ